MFVTVFLFFKRTRDHDHVQSGIDGCNNIRFVIGRYTSVSCPIRNNETLKTKLFLQKISQQIFMAVTLESIPAIIGGHHSSHSGLKRCNIWF